jgi:hypothetical protein
MQDGGRHGPLKAPLHPRHLYWDSQPRRCEYVGGSAFGNNEAQSVRMAGVTEPMFTADRTLRPERLRQCY